MVTRRAVLTAAAALVPLAVPGRKPRAHARTIDDGVGLVARTYAVRIGAPAPLASLWVGNTAPGRDLAQTNPATAPGVSMNAFNGWVSADGLVVTICLWDENTREGAAYRDGRAVGMLMNVHPCGGWAVTGDNAGSLYAGLRPGGHGAADVLGKFYDHVTTDDQRQFGSLAQVAVHSAGTPRGLAVVGSELFVAVPDANAVDVHQTSNLAYLRTLTVPAPTRLASDGTRLWIATGGQVKAYTTAGVATGAAVTDVDTVTALAVSPQGELLVGDDGSARQQVYVYDISGTPTRTETIGVAGGMYATPTGAVGPLRFNGITGVGKDTTGKLYVIQDHPGAADVRTPTFPEAYVTGESLGTGTNIDVYAFTGGSWQRSWQLLGLEFVDNLTVDAATATTATVDAYSADEHYRIDLATNAWTWLGHLSNRFTAPSDRRLMNAISAPLRILTLGGNKYMATTGTDNGFITFYLMGGGEQTTEVLTVFGGRMSIDASGDIWGAHNDYLYRRVFTGLTGNVPQYGAEVAQGAAHPAPFAGTGNVGRIRYDQATDSMYVIGFTTARPKWDGADKVAGSVLARYDNWASGNRVARWTVNTPTFFGSTVSSGDGLGIVSIDQAADQVFGSMLTDESPNGQSRMYAWSAATGAQVATWLPGPAFGECGWVDMYDGVNATVLPNGETLVFQEEDRQAKVLAYRVRLAA